MEAHGVSFVRTGVWMPNAKFIEATGAPTSDFMRNLEAFSSALTDTHSHQLHILCLLAALRSTTSKLRHDSTTAQSLYRSRIC